MTYLKSRPGRRTILQTISRGMIASVVSPVLAACGDGAAGADDGGALGTDGGDGDGDGDPSAETGSGGGDGDMDCAPTPDNIEGPFYRPDAPETDDIAPDMAPGDLLTVSGVVRDEDCAPIPNALLDVWQADADGSYDNDPSQPPPGAGEFAYRGRLYADENGVFSFNSIVPGRYLNGDEYRPAHIHIKVSAEGFELLTTQLYFEGDPFNDVDPFIDEGLIMPVETDADGRRLCSFDFVLLPA